MSRRPVLYNGRLRFMLKEHEIKLKQRLSEILANIGMERYIDDVKEDVSHEFVNRNLNPMRAIFAVSGNLDLQTLTDSEEDIRFLFLLTYALDNALKGRENISINVKEYFYQTEIDRWIDYREEKKEESIFPIRFERAEQLSDNTWGVYLTAQQVHELKISNALLYNFKTQRNPKITAAGLLINIDKTKVMEIRDRLLEGRQFPDPLVWNIDNNGQSNITYSKGTLIVHKGSVINVIDGFHRIVANSLAVEKNPDLKFKWQITLCFLTENGALDFINQKNKQKPMKKEYVVQMDYTKAENMVVSVIADDRLSLLNKVMMDDDKYIKLGKALTKKKIIAQSVKECYNEYLKTQTNIRPIGKWIVEFMDYLMGLYPEEFVNNPYEIKKKSVINHKNMFAGYIALSARLWQKSDWKKAVEKKMEQLDFNNQNPLWRQIGIIGTKDANKSTRDKLYKIFQAE